MEREVHPQGLAAVKHENVLQSAQRSLVLANCEPFPATRTIYGILNRKFPKHKNFPKRDATTPHR
jgi:hypothetical protein